MSPTGSGSFKQVVETTSSSEDRISESHYPQSTDAVRPNHFGFSAPAPLVTMLSRKGSCAGMMSAAAAGVDRSRVGERLQAALAGLQELHLLRDKQNEMVNWALKVDRDEPITRVPAAPAVLTAMGAEEQRLEATLTALKQQLVGKQFLPRASCTSFF